MNPRASQRLLYPLLLAFLSAGVAQAGPSDPVSIPDASLKQTLKTKLGITRDPTESDMLLLTRLDCAGASVSSLTGLEYARNLAILDLSSNRISDVSALSGLTKLTNLGLSGNQISDISSLVGLTKLTFLALDDNRISRVPSLSTLRSLSQLALSVNPLSDISGLSGMSNLNSLSMIRTPLRDISALSGLTNLKDLYIAECQIRDISALAGMTQLTTLFAWLNQISDISALSAMTNMQSLVLWGNQIRDISVLSGLTKLSYLSLSYNQISDISALAAMRHLTRFDIESNPLNAQACALYIPMITANNPGAVIEYNACCATPVITSQPQSQTASPGDSATFSVVASGGSLGYQWRKNGSNLSGATAYTLTINPVAAANAGTYTCVVTNSCGSVTSNEATLTIVTSHTLMTSSGDGGSVTTPGEGTFTYNHGTSVSVVATAEAGYRFVNWTGTAVTAGDVANPTSASTTVMMHNDFTLLANFTLNPQVTLTTSSAGGGAVTSPGEGSFTYSAGVTVSVTATADSHHHFTGWTGTAVTAGKVASPASPTTTVTATASYTLVANFAVDTYSLTITGANGTVSRDPAKASYAYGETVTLQATGNKNYHFSGWSGDVTGSANPITLTMDGNKSIAAGFAANRWSLTMFRTAGGAVASPGEASFQYDEGSSVMLEARPDPLFRFVGWQGSLSSSSNPYSLTMDGDYTIKACFESVLDQLYVGGVVQGDTQEDGTANHPFKAIQEAIDVAKDHAKLTVRPGTYFETLDLSGKDIELNGLSGDPNKITPLPVIDGQGKGTVIRCTQGEDANCAIVGLVITGGSGNLAGGILCVASSPTIQNCLIVGNRATGPDGVGGGIYCRDSKATILNCTITGNYGGTAGAGVSFKEGLAVAVNSILWGNGPSEIQATGTIQPVIAYTDVAGGWPGTGNLNADPLFAGAGYWASPSDLTRPVSASVAAAVWMMGDYHVRSQAGRWNPAGGVWLLDAVTSPCIDSGNPASPAGLEPTPNGNRINLGVYGGTNQASPTKP
jgi:hypothetical protein